MSDGSLKQKVMLYMMERRLTIEEAGAVVKLLESDAKLSYLAGRWDQPAEKLASPVMDSVLIIARGKVIAWMNKYRESHPARALFVGES